MAVLVTKGTTKYRRAQLSSMTADEAEFTGTLVFADDGTTLNMRALTESPWLVAMTAQEIEGRLFAELQVEIGAAEKRSQRKDKRVRRHLDKYGTQQDQIDYLMRQNDGT